MALSHEPCAVANGPAEAVGREVSVGRRGFQRLGPDRQPTG